jgi:hypothetical protein
MPKFGQDLFDGGKYGDYDKVIPNLKQTIRGIPCGLLIRKQFKREIIFRVRRGNGYFSSTQGTLYQDKYKYFVPVSINNTQGAAARNALTVAVNNWKTILTNEEKQEYNQRAQRKRHMSGYNLYIGEYVKANA